MAKEEDFLSIYDDRFEFHEKDKTTIYYEGPQSEETQKRYVAINQALADGFLENAFASLRLREYEGLSDENKNLLRELVDGVTSEVGRALVEVSFLQLTIKCICPEQTIRLHKGATRSNSFSWVNGISMRTLDSTYITPFLRKHNLLTVNKFGAFMTRSLAENYPYTKLYKAEMRGPFDEWIDIVDALENKTMPPKEGLLYLMALLQNKSAHFENEVNEALQLTKKHSSDSFSGITNLLETFFNTTEYSARAFEVVLHGLMQGMQELDLLGDVTLVPMSQMRSANKKHGNIGDIELAEGNIIVESWDAKYGKPYLYDELEELQDKILLNPGVKTAGFIVDKTPDRRQDVMNRLKEVEDYTGVNIMILSFREWINLQTENLNSETLNSLGLKWLSAVVQSFGLKRLDLAPLDEPCEQWIEDLIKVLHD